MEATLSPAATPGTSYSMACAAVSDRGLQHSRNEDRFEIRQSGTGYALVVCDGVSSSKDSQTAAAAAAARIAEYLADALREGSIEDPQLTMRRAISSGQAALAERAPNSFLDDPPSTTVVAALVTDGQVTAGWVGDSRAYWIGPSGSRQLTRDHSWMNDVVSAGKLSVEEAERHPQAHAITRWLGADAGENAAAETTRFAIRPPGILLLCTDGLWNYAPTPEAMAGAVAHPGAQSGGIRQRARRPR
jgi:serine/threonine protein phosphatase PrpC